MIIPEEIVTPLAGAPHSRVKYLFASRGVLLNWSVRFFNWTTIFILGFVHFVQILKNKIESLIQIFFSSVILLYKKVF